MLSIDSVICEADNLDYYGHEIVERLEDVVVKSRRMFSKDNARISADAAMRIEADHRLGRNMAVIGLVEKFEQHGERWVCRLAGTIVRTRPKSQQDTNPGNVNL